MVMITWVPLAGGRWRGQYAAQKKFTFPIYRKFRFGKLYAMASDRFSHHSVG
jgi:hypothetical protein